jgi:hypothetical protein
MTMTPSPSVKMSHGVTIAIDFRNAGAQERSYGPHVTDATVTISIPEEPTVGAVYYLEQTYAEKVIRALVGNYCDGGESHDGGANDYFSPHLKTLERTEFEERRSAVWHVRIETPFTD